MANTMSNLSVGQIEQLNKSLEKLSATIYNSIKIDKLVSKIDLITESVKKLKDSIQKIDLSNLKQIDSDFKKTLELFFSNSAVSIGGYVNGFKTNTEKLGDLYTNLKESYNNILSIPKKNIDVIINEEWFKKIKNAISSIDSLSILMYGGIIALITAVAGTLIYAYNTNEEFRNNVILAWENIKSILQAAYDNIIKPIFDSIVVLCKTVWETGLKPLWNEWSELVSFIKMVPIERTVR